MTTVTVTALAQVSTSSTTPSTTNYYPTISAYDTWYNIGVTDWTCAEGDAITLNQRCVYEMSGVTCVAGQDLVVYSRQLLYDVTASAGVPASEKTAQSWRSLGTTVAGNAVGIINYSETYVAGAGLLVPGHIYSWSVQVMKLRLAGTPTGTLSILDTAASASAAKIR